MKICRCCGCQYDTPLPKVHIPGPPPSITAEHAIACRQAAEKLAYHMMFSSGKEARQWIDSMTVKFREYMTTRPL